MPKNYANASFDVENASRNLKTDFIPDSFANTSIENDYIVRQNYNDIMETAENSVKSLKGVDISDKNSDAGVEIDDIVRQNMYNCGSV